MLRKEHFPLDSLLTFQKIGLFTDIELVCVDGRVKAHRALLSLPFPWLLGIDSSLIILPQIDVGSVKKGIELLYLTLDLKYLRELVNCNFKHTEDDAFTSVEDLEDIFSNIDDSLEEVTLKNAKIKVPCDFCKKLFSALKIKKHMMKCEQVHIEYIAVLPELQCKHCNAVLGEPSALDGVCKFCSGSIEDTGGIFPPVCLDKEDESISCPICGKVFSRKENLTLHVEECKAKENFCKVCGLVFKSKKYLKEHMFIHSDKHNTFRCTECNKLFATSRTLKDHLKIHKDLPKVQCPLCDKLLSTVNILQKHIDTVHNQIRKYECEHCNYKGSTTGNLQQHIDSSHLGIKHECDICSEFFASKASLYTHKKSHSEERKFVCVECGTRFKSKRNLQVHIRSKHSTVTIQCQVCSKILKSQDGLDYHMKHHNLDSQFPCDYCGKRFVTRTKLSHHINIHTGAKPYKCPSIDCEKAFPSSDQLSHHKKNCQKI